MIAARAIPLVGQEVWRAGSDTLWASGSILLILLREVLLVACGEAQAVSNTARVQKTIREQVPKRCPVHRFVIEHASDTFLVRMIVR